jgi:hypothetical protein
MFRELCVLISDYTDHLIVLFNDRAVMFLYELCTAIHISYDQKA